MILTFGQYNTLSATRQRVTPHQLSSQTEFDELMVNYYVAGLLALELITASNDGHVTRYELTQSGKQCMTEYERQNPELAVTRSVSMSAFG